MTSTLDLLRRATGFVHTDIDKAPLGVMLYDAQLLPLGIVRLCREMNGNGPSKERRVLDNGKPQDRFAYRRKILYRVAKERGPVFYRKDRP